MAEKATILIPDISGFAAFRSPTELDHSAPIINERLDLIVRERKISTPSRIAPSEALC